MDKRSLLLIFLFTLIFIGVQSYFTSIDQEDLRKWNAQRTAKLTTERHKIEEEIVNETANAQSLPIANLFADEAKTLPLGQGVLSNGALIVISETPPGNIYVFDNKTGKDLGTYKLRTTLPSPANVAIYGKTDKDLLKIGQLNYFGTFPLQLVSADRIYLANYVDGIFTLPAKRLQEIYRSIDEKAELPPAAQLPSSNAIVLMKMENDYFPVGIYDYHDKAYISLQTLEGLENYAELVPFKRTEKSEAKQEKFYVLENEYQQLVFSSKGGALVEINLPLRDESHPNSVVLPIEVDTQMVRLHPKNALFPLRPYATAPEKQGGAPVEHQQGTLGGYYPLLRRDLVETNKRLSRNVPAGFYGANIVSEYPELAELNYTVKEFTKEKIVFEAQQTNRRITKTFKLDGAQAPYCFTLDVQIEGDNRSLWLTSGVPEAELISNAPAPALKYRFTRGTSSEVKQIDLPQEAATYSQVQPDWVCNSNGFFGIIADPLMVQEGGFRVQKVSGETLPSRLVELGQDSDSLPGYMTLLPIKGQAGKGSYRFFAGPFATDLLNAIDKHYSDPETGYNPDYISSQTFHGWFGFISGPFAKFLFILMNFFHWITGSWGFSIILLTVALRIMMYPLNAWSMRSTVKMQEIAPEVSAIQEKYKKDPKKAQMEIIDLYKKKGVNPFSGCIPLLIQLPFLIGMFDLLKSSFELRGASFIPGWIDNLAAPDVLFTWGYSLPFIGNQFHLLPILTGVVMFLQQRWMTTQKDPAEMSDKDRQQKSMGTIFALMFMFMFYNFPSGINIYWISTSLLGMLQQWWTKRRIAAASAEPVIIDDKRKPIKR